MKLMLLLFLLVGCDPMPSGHVWYGKCNSEGLSVDTLEDAAREVCRAKGYPYVEIHKYGSKVCSAGGTADYVRFTCHE